MRVILVSTSRSGSHARCSEFENPLYECLNIEDLLLPRNSNGDINNDILTDDLLQALENHNWENAWHHRVMIPDDHYIKDYDSNLQIIYHTQYPTLADFLKKIEYRIQCLNKIPSWCIKIMKYHGLDNDTIKTLINISDTVIRLQRKDILQQCISQYLAKFNNSWHNATGNAGTIDYEKFESVVGGVIDENRWIEEKFSSITCEYYEDLSFNSNTWTKNNVILQYNEHKCKEIIKHVQRNN